MTTFLITYDPQDKEQCRETLFEAIRALAHGHWHFLPSTWIIKCPGPATAIHEALLPLVHDEDRLLVLELTGSGSCMGFSERGTKWLEANL